MSLGTVAGSAVQCASALAAAHTPKVKACGVAVKARAKSVEKPSSPVTTTVNPQPEPGCPPRVEVGTLKVMNREMELALISMVPSVLP